LDKINKLISDLVRPEDLNDKVKVYEPEEIAKELAEIEEPLPPPSKYIKKKKKKKRKPSPWKPPTIMTKKNPGNVGFSHKKFLSKSELDHLNTLLKKYFYKDKRNVLLIHFALNTGARASEILNMRYEDFNPGTACVFINTLKAGKPRELPIPKWLFREVRKLPQDESGRMFPISYQRLGQIWDMYRPNKNKPFHSLRHTFAMNLFAKTKELRMVQLALGHRSIQNTMIYADYYYTTKELRQKMISSEWRWF